ncbi:MAG: hypothetical protein ACLQBK_12885 [Candidatus Sulfotelmatobacter sp.]
MVIFPQHPSSANGRNLLRPENRSHRSHRFVAKAASWFAQALSLQLLLQLHGLAAGPPADRIPIQAELVKSIEAGRVQVGDPVYAKVDLAWNNSACKLREGAILKGRIVTQTPRSKAVRSSGIALLFDSGQCGGRDMKPLPLTVAAVLAPDPNRGSSLFGDQQSQPLNEAVDLSLSQGGSGSPMRSMLAAAQTVMLEPPRNKPPQLVMPGQVIGIGDVKLAVGSGPEGSSILTSEKHNLRLESGSRLVLVPSVAAAAALSSAAESAAGPAPESPNPPGDTGAFDETEICVSPDCSLALSANQADTSSRTADFTMPLKPLGFAESADQAMYDLDHANTISYVGSKRLLFTFNPHLLVPRTTADITLPKLHVVRAALIDLPTLRVLRTVEWRIQDTHQYLWPIGPDHVLVHVGGELRLYDDELKVEQRLPLNAPLAFVAVAPLGTYMAVGIVRERHSEEIHRELRDVEDREPEEDVEVNVLDSGFHRLACVMRSSREVPPVLSEGGEIRIPTIGRNHWRIAEYSWTGQRRILTQVASTCRPQAASVPPNLLFVTGCDRLGDGKWFRVLRPDGKPVLKGESQSTEKGYTASGTSGSNFFAVGITELTKAMDDSAPFHSSDLKSLRVGVYRVENGKKVTGVTIPDPLPTVQTFALSPDSRHLAILENGQIVFYSFPEAAERE